MKVAKKMALKLVVVGELLIVLLFYYYGHQGMRTIRSMTGVNEELEKQRTHEQVELARCEQTLSQWRLSPFYKEKIAREDLQMARSSDTIFYLTHKPHGQYSSISR